MYNCPECWAPFDTQKEMMGHKGKSHKIKVKKKVVSKNKSKKK